MALHGKALLVPLSLSLLLTAFACGDKDGGSDGGVDSGADAGDDGGDDGDGGSDGGDDDGGEDSGQTEYLDIDEDGYTEDVDCDDDDPEVHPDAEEICDGKDNDCDESTQEGEGAVTGGVQYDTLQAAIDAAKLGENVEVCSGTFNEAVTIDKTINLVSELGPSYAVIDASGLDAPALSITGGIVVVSGFGITGAEHAGDGGGVYVSSPDNVLLADVYITGNTAERGGGLFVDGVVNVELQFSTVEANTAEHGGGVFGNEARVNLNSVEILSNTATVSGGGISGNEGDLRVNSGAVKANEAKQGGGASVDDDSELTVTGSDWGKAKGDDNVPHDVWTPAGTFDYEGIATFSCDPGGC